MPLLLIEENNHGVHEWQAQGAIAQVPQITRPDAFEPTAIDQLAKDGFDAIAYSRQNTSVGSESECCGRSAC